MALHQPQRSALPKLAAYGLATVAVASACGPDDVELAVDQTEVILEDACLAQTIEQCTLEGRSLGPLPHGELTGQQWCASQLDRLEGGTWRCRDVSGLGQQACDEAATEGSFVTCGRLQIAANLTFDEGINDVSQAGHHGVCIGNCEVTPSPAFSGSKLVLNGETGLSMPPMAIKSADGFAVAFWLFADPAQESTRTVLRAGTSDEWAEPGWYIRLSANDEIQLGAASGGDEYLLAQSSAPAGFGWQHVVVGADDGGVHFMVNGREIELAHSDQAIAAANTRSLQLGGHLGDATENLHAGIDHFRVYDRRLSNDQAQALYHNAKDWLWYEPSNGHKAGGWLDDFATMFEDPKQWIRARDQLGVLMMRGNTLRNLGPEFVETTFAPAIRTWGLRLALNAGGATWSSCRPNAAAIRNLDFAIIDQVRAGGADVHYVSLQSVLSKPVPDHLKDNCPDYGPDQRIADVVEFAQELDLRFPGIRLGIIDALVAKGKPYRDTYMRLVSAMADAGFELDHIFLDHPWEQAQYGPSSWDSILEAANHVRNTIGVAVGITHVSSEGGNTSSLAYRERTLDHYRRLSLGNHSFDHHILMSWFPYPDAELPEDHPSDYPLTKILLELSQEILYDE